MSLETPQEEAKTNRQLEKAITEAMDGAEFPDLKAIICQFMRSCGGAKGVARMLKREYRDAKPGSMIRSMILQMILQGAKSVSQNETSRDTSLISDEDLARETEALIGKVANSGKYPANG